MDLMVLDLYFSPEINILPYEQRKAYRLVIGATQSRCQNTVPLNIVVS